MKVLVSNVQRLCFQDGPGLRTTVFSMGCPIKCLWCCNPENLTHSVKTCGNKTWGKYYETDELIELLLRDRNYYGEDGGITFSGGEFLTHIDEFEEVLLKLKTEHINLCVETSLYCTQDNLGKALQYFDEFIIDFKILTTVEAEAMCAADPNVFMRNFRYFAESCDTEYTVRIPCMKYSAEENNLDIICSMISDRRPSQVEVFKIHNLGISKYNDLGLEYKYDESLSVSDETMDKVKEHFSDKGLMCNIIKIN